MDIDNLSEYLNIDKSKIVEAAYELTCALKQQQTYVNLSTIPTDVLKDFYSRIAKELCKRERKDNNDKLNQIKKMTKGLCICREGDTYYPHNNTSKQDCYEILQKIQMLFVD